MTRSGAPIEGEKEAQPCCTYAGRGHCLIIDPPVLDTVCDAHEQLSVVACLRLQKSPPATRASDVRQALTRSVDVLSAATVLHSLQCPQLCVTARSFYDWLLQRRS